jgi:hypothetical protein
MNFFDATMKPDKPLSGNPLEKHVTLSECASYTVLTAGPLTYNRPYDYQQMEVTSSGANIRLGWRKSLGQGAQAANSSRAIERDRGHRRQRAMETAS